MADFSALKTSIQNYIKQNGNEEITGNLLQQILLSMVTTLGDSAINDLVTALNAEIANRGNADTTLQGNIDNEATARGNADTELNGRITTLQGVVNGIVANVENGYVYAGIATPSTTPASGKVFYLALTAGTYTKFGATVVPQGINILKYNGSAWSLDSFLGLDDAPTQGSSNLVKSGGVLDSIIKDGSAFDLSAYNNGATYADLSAALTALNALPAAYKKGGMSFKYVQTSDNKYVQWRNMNEDWSTTVTDWQGVDEEPTTGSNNLVKSGGVAKLSYCYNFTEDKAANLFVKEIYIYSTNTSIYNPSDYSWKIIRVDRGVSSGASWSIILNDGNHRFYNFTTNIENENVIHWNNSVIEIYMVVNWDAIPNGQSTYFNQYFNNKIFSLRYSPTIWTYLIQNRVKIVEDKTNELWSYNWSNMSSYLVNEGWVKTNGVDVQVSVGSGYYYTDYLNFNAGDIVKYAGEGHTAFSHVTFYDGSKNVLQTNIATTAGEWIDDDYTAPSNTAYVRFTYQISSFSRGGVLRMSVDIYKNSSEQDNEKYSGTIIMPKRIYTVLNDIDVDFTEDTVAHANLKENNFSSALYLDHCLIGLQKELDIHFGLNKDVKTVFTSPARMSSGQAAVLNNGQNVNKANIVLSLTGNNIGNNSFTIEHVSTLNSATKDERAGVLIIGDSVTYGQYANISDVMSNTWYRYAALMEELGIRDRILNGTYGTQNDDEYIIKTMGRYPVVRNGVQVRDRTGSYKNVDYSFPNRVTAYPGATTLVALNGFLYDGHYSISKFLEERRTCDDLGVKLTGSAGQTVIGSDGLEYTIGTNIQDGELYWKPSHIVLALGLNDLTVSEWYTAIQSFIDDVKADYTTQGWDAPMIGVAIMDTANTVFPSKHKNCDKECIEWLASDTRHASQYAKVQKWYQEHGTDNEDTEKLWLLPFFWCVPPADSVSYRETNLPAVDILEKDEFRSSFAFGASTHVNAVGHYHMAYSLYSWIKYTLTL